MLKSKVIAALLTACGAVMLFVPLYVWFHTPDMPLMHATKAFGLIWIDAAAFLGLSVYFWSEY